MENIIELYNISYDIKNLCNHFPHNITINNIPIIKLYNKWFDIVEDAKDIPKCYMRAYMGYLDNDIFLFAWDAPSTFFENNTPLVLMNTKTFEIIDYDERVDYNFSSGYFRNENYHEMKKIYPNVCDLYFI